MKKVAFIMGSDSDLPVAEKAFEVFKEYSVPFEAHVYSAHRTPAEAKAFAESAADKGFGAIICAAGMAAHLAGAFAANTVLPVIGIPVKSSFDGLDALLATVQMPAGIPVVSDAALTEKLKAARRAAAEKVLKKDAEISAEYHL